MPDEVGVDAGHRRHHCLAPLGGARTPEAGEPGSRGRHRPAREGEGDEEEPGAA